MVFFEAYADACGEASKLLDLGQQPETLHPVSRRPGPTLPRSTLSLKGPVEAGNGPGVGKVLGCDQRKLWQPGR